MRRILLAGLAVMAIAAQPLSAQTAEDIVTRNIEAKGGLQKIKAIQTVRITGKMTVGPGMEAPMVLEFKRPNLMRLDITLQGMTGTQAWDGTTGWMLMPFMGRTEPEPIPSEMLKDIEEMADFDGPLVDWKQKGHSVELMGKETVEGTDTYKLKLTLKNGDVRYFFIDAEHFLEIRAEGKRMQRGTEVEAESTIGDYKSVGGLMLAHAIEGGVKGVPVRQKMTFEKIELDVPIDDARFKMPAKK